MTTDARSRIVTLAALLVVMAGVLAWQFWPASSQAPQTAGATGGRPDRAAAPAAIDPGALEVNLKALEGEDIAPRMSGRDPFGFRAAPPPPPPSPVAARAPDAGEDGPAGPAPPPPPPPIALKFIGLLVEGPSARKIAVLSDGRYVFHGREGDIIEGRFRVVRIGDESIQMEHIDGRGRQTIRLSGS